MFKVKLGDLVQAEPTLNKLFEEVNSNDVNFIVKYKVTKFVKAITPELKDYYETYDSLLKKFGTEELEEDKPTGRYNVAPEKQEIFRKNWEKLLEYTVDLPVTKFKPEDFCTINKLNNMDTILLSPFIEGDIDVSNRKKIDIKFEELGDESSNEQA